MANYDLQDRRLFPRIMSISSAHLSKRTARYLQQADAVDFPCLGGHWGKIGWTFWVDVEFGILPSLSPDLREVFEFANDLDVDMVLFDECGPLIRDLKIYRQDVAHNAYDEYSDRERRSDEDLEDHDGQLALDRLIGDHSSKASPQYFGDGIAKICDVLADHCLAHDVLSFPFIRLEMLSELASACRLCVRKEPGRYQSILSILKAAATQIANLIDQTPMAHRGRERKVSDALENIHYRLKAAITFLLEK
ncbi:hypothetical protein HFN06_06075 [Rhizobium leguminosarum]|uniref:DUF5983 family protein n=1 Tax=Rhizobium TaxID=379 RepID=UPI0014421C01|nr:hypothetical protein [Rhizobium leguminosarum]MCA2431011.1 hypothetical protein [Rhizobium leguminosarum]NKK09141.1 hypothetical protein [Rhizobium leguminosarum bv. viciae]